LIGRTLHLLTNNWTRGSTSENKVPRLLRLTVYSLKAFQFFTEATPMLVIENNLIFAFFWSTLWNSLPSALRNNITSQPRLENYLFRQRFRVVYLSGNNARCVIEISEGGA